MRVIKNLFLLIFGVGLAVAPMQLEGTYLWKKGRLVDVSDVATMSAQEHLAVGKSAFDRCLWREAATNFRVISLNFPASPCAEEANFLLGVSLYNLEEYEESNEALSSYLKASSAPERFQEALEYKFAIAEAFSKGAKRRFFGVRKLPKWAGGEELALEIYDEVIAAMPTGDLAACSLYSKGALLYRQQDYVGSIDAFQLLVRRFPKDELTPACYVAISRIYLKRAKSEFQNPDLLAMAQLNERRMAMHLPRHDMLEVVANNVAEIKERYARGLYDTGCFYERVQKPEASLLYYRNAIHQFPDTKVAQLCQKRIDLLAPVSCEASS